MLKLALTSLHYSREILHFYSKNRPALLSAIIVIQGMSLMNFLKTEAKQLQRQTVDNCKMFKALFSTNIILIGLNMMHCADEGYVEETRIS